MITPSSPTSRKTFESNTCPSDVELLDLIDDSQTDAPRAPLIAHLDRCDSCRDRLETIAADEDQWDAVRRNLNQESAEGDLQSERLTAAIAAIQSPTRRDIPVARADLPPIRTSPQGGDVPSQIGDYQIIQRVGRGGMGEVYKAYDPSLDRIVAIKWIADSLAQYPDSLARFRREARSAAAVHNPHVVSIHAIEESSPHPYLVMEFVDGESLEDRLRHGDRLDWKTIARIGAEVATGLAAAHANGVIHRDVKPGNILIERSTGLAKITDFGLARSIEDSSLTQTGCVRGTPEYIAPEQAAGERANHRADLFSLGSTLYAACAGQPPFRADNTLAVLRRTREDQPTSLRAIRDDLPDNLIDVIERLLCKDPDNRFASAGEVAKVLRLVHDGQPVAIARPMGKSRRVSGRSSRVVWGVSLLCIAAIMAGGIFAAGQLPMGENGESLLALAKDKKPKKERPAASDDAAPSQEAAPQAATKSDGTASPARVQIVTPEQLMRERIQAEKDELELPRHPLLVREFVGHTGPVSAIAWTPDGTTLVSCSGWPSGDRTARAWSVKKGEELRQFDTTQIDKNPGDSGPREAPGEFFTVAVTPDGKQAVTGSTGGGVCVWDITTGKLVRQLNAHATVYDVAVSPHGNMLLTGARDSIARLWDLTTGEERMKLAGHRSWLRTVAFTPDGTRALTGSYDHVVRLWDLERAEMVREFRPAKEWVWDIAVAPSGSIAAAVSGSSVEIWDLDSGELLRSLTTSEAGNGTCVDISPDGRLAATGGYDGKVRLWSLDSGELLETYTGHREWVWSVKFSPDGKQIASSGGGRDSATGGKVRGIDFAIRLWNLPPTRPQVVKP